MTTLVTFLGRKISRNGQNSSLNPEKNQEFNISDGSKTTLHYSK